MFKIFTTVSLLTLVHASTPAFSANDCILLDQYSSTIILEHTITKELTYLVAFDNDESARSCLKDLSSDFDRACNSLNEGQLRAKEVLITLTNQLPGKESVRVKYRGECKESQVVIFVDGQFRSKLKFESVGKPTIERNLKF